MKLIFLDSILNGPVRVTLTWVLPYNVSRCYPNVSVITRGEMTNQSPVLRVTWPASANQRPVLATCPSLSRGHARYWTTTPGWCEVWRCGLTSIRINKYQATNTARQFPSLPCCLPLGFSFNFPELYLRLKDQKYCIMMINCFEAELCSGQI